MTAGAPGGSGWVPVAQALPPGEVTEAQVGDLDLVVWRTASGRACVFEARCPHQWSHLAYEGAVDGDELVCLSHYWRFDPDGRGTKLNVNGRRDDKADIAVFECRDTDGVVWLRMPGSGEDAAPPDATP